MLITNTPCPLLSLEPDRFPCCPHDKSLFVMYEEHNFKVN